MDIVATAHATADIVAAGLDLPDLTVIVITGIVMQNKKAGAVAAGHPDGTKIVPVSAIVVVLIGAARGAAVAGQPRAATAIMPASTSIVTRLPVALAVV